MKLPPVKFPHWLLAAALTSGISSTAIAQTAQGEAAGNIATPMPFYTAEQVLKGVYTHRLPALASGFALAAHQLALKAQSHCTGLTPVADLRNQWLGTLLAWQTLSSPSVGPIVSRRTQREIDFWPMRERLLQQALQRAPKTLADMERVGTPAKGFPAFDDLLEKAGEVSMPPDTCAYALLIAQGIEAEAVALEGELDGWAQKAWAESEEDTRAAFAEWVNQWLASLERLRWAYIEKPLQVHRTTSTSAAQTQPIEWARRRAQDNVADRQAQWKGLLAMARLEPRDLTAPPSPGQALVPIEALLRGKGHIQLASQWGAAIDAVSTTLSHMQPQASTTELLALAAQMKTVATLLQTQVAGALDVPLGFSDADGD